MSVIEFGEPHHPDMKIVSLVLKICSCMSMCRYFIDFY